MDARRREPVCRLGQSSLMSLDVATQGADQLSRYGANVYMVDLIGLYMLRDFAQLVTAKVAPT